MKQIDRLVIKELLGPWIFGVAMFSALLMAATYLNKIAEYVVRGLSPVIIGKITLLLMPAILAKTFAMSMLLSSLLAFGRLSSDSEVTALRAAGASVPRIVRPVFLFSLLVAAVTFFVNDQVAPPAERTSLAMVMSIDNLQSKAGAPVFFPIDGALVVAQRFDTLNSKLFGVTLVVADKNGDPTLYMHCKELEYHRDTQEWHIRGGASLVPADGGVRSDVAEAWPKDVPKPKVSPQDIATINNKDMDVYSMADAVAQIESGRRNGTLDQKTIRNLEFGYWNKISVALAAIVFGTLGAVLGIRNQRTNASTGFALAVAIIFGYFMVVNFMNVWALNGILPPWVASFAPVVVGMVCSCFMMWRRNQ